MKNKFAFLLPLILPLVLLLVWHFASLEINNKSVLPSISSVAYHFIHPSNNFIGLGTLGRNIGFSLVRVLLGYSFGALLGLSLGLLMGYYKPICQLLDTFIQLFKPIPPLAWQPLVLGWFGVSSLATLFQVPYGLNFVLWDNYKLSMIFLIAMGSFFPIVTNTLFGVKKIRKTLVESAKVLGAGEKDLFFHILLPAASPSIINGLRLGLATAWGCLVGAEMLPGSVSGVGYLITHAYELARIDLVITGIITIGVVGAFLDNIFKIIDQKYFSWESKIK